MPALGAPINARLAAIYTIGAAYAGVAGGLMAQTTQFVALDVLAFNRSAELLLILVLGGSGSLYGAILGTIVFMSAHHVLSDMNPEYWQFWLGALMLVIVLFARDGVMGGVRAAARRGGSTCTGGNGVAVEDCVACAIASPMPMPMPVTSTSPSTCDAPPSRVTTFEPK